MRSGAKRKSHSRTGTRMALVLITVVISSLALFLGARISTLKKKEAQYSDREKSLGIQVEEQEERAEELEERRIFVQTRQYIEQIAKEKLGLTMPDEILLKPEE